MQTRLAEILKRATPTSEAAGWPVPKARREADIQFFAPALMDAADGDLECVNALRKVIGARAARVGKSAEEADAILVEMIDGVIGIRKAYSPAVPAGVEGVEVGTGVDDTTPPG